MEKMIILNGINNKNNGVIRVDDKEKVIKINLNIPKDNYILLLQSDKTVGYKITDLVEEILVNDVDLSGSLVALLVKNNEGKLYGSIGTDRLKAFSLLSFYKKNNNKITIKEVEKYDKNKVKQVNKKEKIGEIEKVITKENDNILENSEQLNKENVNENEDINKEKTKRKEQINVDKIIERNNKNMKENNVFLEMENNENNAENKSEEQEDYAKINKEKIMLDGRKCDKIEVNKNEKKEDKCSLIDDGLVYKGENFYLAIHNQIDEIFVCYKEEETLNKLIKNSRWARIDYSKEEYYVIGVIKENEEVKYIAYGIPGVYSIKPPKEVNGFAKWLSINEDNPKGEGYWLIYQDAKNGNTIKIG